MGWTEIFKLKNNIMASKTKEQLEDELGLIKTLKEEREESNKLYARMIVQTIVFTMLGMIAAAFLTILFIKIGWK
jgi:hypothetical protein